VGIKSYAALEDEARAIAFETYLKSGSGRAFAKSRVWKRADVRGFAESETAQSESQQHGDCQLSLRHRRNVILL